MRLSPTFLFSLFAFMVFSQTAIDSLAGTVGNSVLRQLLETFGNSCL